MGDKPCAIVHRHVVVYADVGIADDVPFAVAYARPCR
jgi:hypothetical protein